MKVASWTWFGLTLLAGVCILPSLCYAKAILGIDLGSLYIKVALVQRGAPLEIVTNLHSKRKTENMILFDSGTRYYGADASSLLARKPLKTPASMTVLLGRDDTHPTVQVLAERHYPITPRYNETRAGVYVTVDGQDFTPEELVAMLLGHTKDITHAHGGSQGNTYGVISDCVLTVPSFYTQHERKALLDAAALADFKVLALIDENTAAALHFAMDKLYEEPKIMIFYNLGGSSLQVSVIKFMSYQLKEKYSKEKTVGGFEVLGKAWDSTLGGQAFDQRLVDYLAEQFNHQWDKKRGDGQKKDVREIPRAMTKLRLQANKVKHVLSANTEFPIYMESLHDDTPLSTHMTRVHLEELCHDLLERSIAPLHEALKRANVTLEQVDGIELIGGGMRVPRIQAELQKVLGEIELGMHINADESMALGAAFHGANISTAFRVRHVGMTDINPFPISISLEDLQEEKKGLFGKNKKDDEEPWSKQATIFKPFAKVGVKKTIAFTHDSDVHCAIDYEESDLVPSGTGRAIERYNITGVADFAKEMEEKGLGKPKVSLQFELTSSGITQLVKAEAAVEETYTVEEEEEVEVDDDEAEEEAAEGATEEKDDEAEEEESRKLDEDAENETDTKDSETKDGDEEEKKPKKKKKTILVEKEKKKTHKSTLKVVTYEEGKIKSYTSELMEESKSKLEELARKDKERVQLEEAKNKVESYIYLIKNKLVDDEEAISKVSTEEQREEIRKLAEDGEEWLYDEGYDADLATMEDKYAELSTPAEKIFFRVSEMSARPEAILELQAKLVKVTELVKKWETSMPQVTEEERGDVLSKVEEVKEWIKEKEEAQAKADPTDDPVFTSEEVPLQTKSLESLVARLLRKPKPKPKKNATDAENATDTENATATEDDKAEADGEESSTKETEADADESETQDAATEEEAEEAEEGAKEEADEEDSSAAGEGEL